MLTVSVTSLKVWRKDSKGKEQRGRKKV